MAALCWGTVFLVIGVTCAQGVRQPNSTVLAPTYVVNLDLAPEQRWTDVVKIYRSSAPLIVDYFTGQVNMHFTIEIACDLPLLPPSLPDFISFHLHLHIDILCG